MTTNEAVTASAGKWMRVGVAALALAGASLASVEPAAAFGGPRFIPHGGFRGGFGGFRGGYGGFRGGYGGWRGRGYGYGLGGLGAGLLLGGALGYGYGAYGYPYGGYGNGYYGAGYGGYGYGGDPCLRRVWGPYGPHWVNVCY